MSKKDEIFDMIMEMHKNTRFSVYEVDQEKIQKFIEFHINKGFVFFEDGCLMLGRACSPWYNNNIHASDSLLFVMPESRGKGLAKKAISKFIEWAKERGARDISIAQTSGVNLNNFKGLAESLSLKKVGEVYNVFK